MNDSTLALDERKCPLCAETIKQEAIRCKHCHGDLAVAPPVVNAQIPFNPKEYKPGEVREWKKDDSWKEPSAPPAKSGGMGWLSKTLIAVVLLGGAFLLFGANEMNTPQGKAQAAARNKSAYCWSEYERKSAAPDEKRMIASVCERFDADYKKTYGRAP